MNTKMQTKKAKRGFTITELVIVIAVIAILAAVLIPTFSNVINRANESAAMQEAKSEWDNFSPEVVLSEDDTLGDDFLLVYKEETDSAKYFAVINGQFNTDPVTLSSDSFTLDNITYKKGASAGHKEDAAAAENAVLKDYVIQNDNITIYKLTVSTTSPGADTGE